MNRNYNPEFTGAWTPDDTAKQSVRVGKMTSAVEQAVAQALLRLSGPDQQMSVANIIVTGDLKQAKVWLHAAGVPEVDFTDLADDIAKAATDILRKQVHSKFTPRVQVFRSQSQDYADSINKVLT